MNFYLHFAKSSKHSAQSASHVWHGRMSAVVPLERELYVNTVPCKDMWWEKQVWMTLMSPPWGEEDLGGFNGTVTQRFMKFSAQKHLIIPRKKKKHMRLNLNLWKQTPFECLFTLRRVSQRRRMPVGISTHAWLLYKRPPECTAQLLKSKPTQSDVTDTFDIGSLKLLSSKGQSGDVRGIWHWLTLEKC